MNLNEKRRDVAREICRCYGITLSVDILHAFADMLEPFKVLRGHRLLEEGQVCDYMYYVERGLLLQYYKKKNVSGTKPSGKSIPLDQLIIWGKAIFSKSSFEIP